MNEIKRDVNRNLFLIYSTYIQQTGQHLFCMFIYLKQTEMLFIKVCLYNHKEIKNQLYYSRVTYYERMANKLLLGNL